MCRQVTCPECKKPTFAGCGMHIEQVLGHVPPEQRCKCREAKSESSTKSAVPNVTPTMWNKLFGG